MYDWHHYHIIGELRFSGHDVIYCDPVEILGRTGTVDEYSEVLVEQAKELWSLDGVDLLFGTATDTTLRPDAIREISHLGVPTVNLATDDLSVPFHIREIAGSFDLTWTSVRENEGLLKSYGAKTIVMPWAANPHVFKPTNAEEEQVIGFVGTCYGARAQHAIKLFQAGIPVRIYGKPPRNNNYKSFDNPATRALRLFRQMAPHVYQSMHFPSGRKCVWSALKRSFVEILISTDRSTEESSATKAIEYLPGPSFENVGDVFSRLALSLGSLELGSTYVLKTPLLFIRLREFEVPMCGGVHIANRSLELQEYFDEDKEMLYYDNPEELVDKARFYLHPARDAIRARIRQQARARSVRQHTWTHRFNKIFASLGI